LGAAKRALVTGAAGFVGANLVRRLLDEGHAVTALVRPGSDRWRLEGLDLSVREVELADEAAVARSVEEARPEWAFHLAAHGAYSTQRDHRRMFRTNVDGLVNLLDACAGVELEAFVNTGSSSEYGLKASAPDERSWLEPNSAYAVTKAAATLYCRHVGQSGRLPLRTLRLYSAFGPWEEPSRFVPTLMVRCLEGRLPALVSPGTARDFVHVEDVVEAYLLAASRGDQEPGAVYNVGTGAQTTIGQAVEHARRLFGVAEEARWGSMAARSWDTSAWVADSRLARRALGWAPRHDFATGLAATRAWLLASDDRVRARYAEGAAR
jgi:nucleoside-diphosphate-sugar epimerase